MKKKITVIISVLVAVVVAVSLLLRNDHHEDRLLLSGNVEVTEVNVGFKISGRIAGLFTDEGRYVNKGDRIARLDSAEHESLVAQGRALLANAEAALEKAKRDRERAELLYQSGAISAQQIDAARTALNMALAQREQAEAALGSNLVRLKDTILYAPVSGVILKKNVEQGEIVSAGTAIFTIGDLDNPWVKVYVKEDRLGLVKLGQRAEITTDSYPGKVYEGEVSYISSEAEFTPKTVQTQEERVKLVFGVKINVKNEDNELKPGMPADVKILLK